MTDGLSAPPALPMLLPHGLTLVEANAGTGKTETLSRAAAALFAAGFVNHPRRLVVVTYTVSAAGELAGRIRQTMQTLHDAMAPGGNPEVQSGNGLPTELLNALNEAGVPPADVRRNLRLALGAFDEALVSTIHAFCRRLLRDHALDLGAPMDELPVVAGRQAWNAAARDFWRVHVHRAHPIVGALVNWADLTPERLATQLAPLLADPGCTGVVPDPALTADTLVADIVSTAANVAQRLREDEAAVEAQMASLRQPARDKLSAALRSVSSAGSVGDPELALLLDDLLTLGGPDLDNVKARASAPTHSAFALCRRLRARALAWRANFRAAAAAWMKEARTSEIGAGKGVTFDEMIGRVATAFSGPGGKTVARRVAASFDAALIDEFQDTDSAQYAVLRAVFGQPHQRVLLVGDPKQSIYGFRGADLGAYLAVARELRSQHRAFALLTNYRSQPGLVRAVNAMFTRDPGVFGEEGLQYQPSGSPPEMQPDRDDGQPPLRIMIAGDPANPFSRIEDARTAVAKAIAQALAGLLKENPPTRDLSGVAILVRRSSELPSIREALAANGIPFVSMVDESVFESSEALYLRLWMDALLNPSDPGRILTALATPLHGWPLSAFWEARQEESALNLALEQTARTREIWLRAGFAAAFRGALWQNGLPARLASEPGGQRVLTNLSHLVELISDAEQQGRLTPAGLIAWLETRRAGGTGASPAESEDAHPRLESDANAVRILTVHRAKGLQFDQVFVSGIWMTGDAGRADADTPLKAMIFSSPDGTIRREVDLGTDPRRSVDANEEIRTLYVALTRARNACHLILPIWKNLPSGATGRLLAIDKAENLPAAVAELAAAAPAEIAFHFADCDASPPETRPALAQSSNFAIPKCTANSGPLVFRGDIPSSRLLASFSSIAGDRHGPTGGNGAGDVEAVADEPSGGEGDVALDAAATAELADELGGFPPGRRTGLFFHKLLEDPAVLVQPPDSGALQRALRYAGLPPQLAPAAQHRLHTLAHCFIPDPAGPQGPPIGLGDLHRLSWQAETKFHLPCKGIDRASLAIVMRRRFGAPGEETARRLEDGPTLDVEGFLTGQIDGLFLHDGRCYLLDWKTNRIGTGSDAMERAIASGLYLVQMAIYMAALRRQIARHPPARGPVEGFGGAIYPFLRALAPEQSTPAAFVLRPDPQILSELEVALGIPA